MHIIVDTNVLAAANGKAVPQASPQCVISCIHKLQHVQQNQILVIDSKWLILREYQQQASSTGQPSVGDAFLKWILTNQANPTRCEQVAVTELGPHDFQEFPDDPALTGFDPSDRKFVAVALAHPACPPIANAVDSDWRDFQPALMVHCIEIEFLCPDVVCSTAPAKRHSSQQSISLNP